MHYKMKLKENIGRNFQTYHILSTRVFSFSKYGSVILLFDTIAVRNCSISYLTVPGTVVIVTTVFSSKKKMNPDPF